MSALYHQNVTLLNSTGEPSAERDSYNVGIVSGSRSGADSFRACSNSRARPLPPQFRNPVSGGLFRDFQLSDRAPFIAAAQVTQIPKVFQFGLWFD